MAICSLWRVSTRPDSIIFPHNITLLFQFVPCCPWDISNDGFVRDKVKYYVVAVFCCLPCLGVCPLSVVICSSLPGQWRWPTLSPVHLELYLESDYFVFWIERLVDPCVKHSVSTSMHLDALFLIFLSVIWLGLHPSVVQKLLSRVQGIWLVGCTGIQLLYDCACGIPYQPPYSHVAHHHASYVTTVIVCLVYADDRYWNQTKHSKCQCISSGIEGQILVGQWPYC